MRHPANESVQREIEEVFRIESRYALATLFRILGEFHLAEDALQEAFASALEKWPKEGIPGNPRGWLISTARFKAIDQLRRQRRLVHSSDVVGDLPYISEEFDALTDDKIEDDLLRLIFMCCHPGLSIEAQVALTLREVCGLSTGEVARAFLVPEATMAQRMVRAKAKLKQSGAAFEVPSTDELPARLASVLRVIYLVFNEGYYASSGESLTSPELSAEALRLGELLCVLMPRSEVFGLTALMCLSESRRAARTQKGEIVLLEDQDRGRWDRGLIEAGNGYLSRAWDAGVPGAYALQAAIAAEHANAPLSGQADWARVVELYDQLDGVSPSPVVKLNRAVAVAMDGHLDRGLGIIEGLLQGGGLEAYGLAHAAKADLLRRSGRWAEARDSYKAALELTTLEPERRFLERRIAEIDREIG
jgi:RNA polymerase sigma-70 factor (ECF subfamily)